MASLLALLLLSAAIPCKAITLTTPKAFPANLVTDGYNWPSGRGHVSDYSTGGFRAPFDLPSSLAWTWHDPAIRYRKSPVGVNLDDKDNLYVTFLDGIRKFSPDGELLWEYAPERGDDEEMPDTASLYNGHVYCSTTHGWVFALSMATGEVAWSTKLAGCDGNNGWVTAYESVVLLGSDPFMGADRYVSGLNATDGRLMWQYKPVAPVWNFMGSHVGDGTFIFQDYEGRAYRNRLSDGSNIWQSGGRPQTWTDGTALLGPNGVVYTVNTRHDMQGAGADGHGDVNAFALQDGRLLWSREVPRPPNNQPAVGRLHGRSDLSLVQPIGQQVLAGAPTDVYALDAATGEVQWVFKGPVASQDLQAGDRILEAQFARKADNVRSITLPNPWGAPSVDADGTVFLGNQEGALFALRDTNGDGTVAGSGEVSSFNTSACFSGSSSPALGRGMLAVGSIDALYVFKG